MAKLTLFYTFFFLVPMLSFAQIELTNKDIVSMQTAKLGNDIISTKILNTKCYFDLTTNGLIELELNKIPDKLIKLMFQASPPKENITNDDVIKLSQGEVSRDIIKEKIKITNHVFNIETDELIRLKANKVHDSIVKEMILNPIQKQEKTTINQVKIVDTPSEEKIYLKDNPLQAEKITGADKIIVTYAYDEIKSFKRISEIKTSAKKLYGKQNILREEAIQMAKKEAFLKGATHLLIQSDNFGYSPVNNIAIVAVAYKR